MWDQITTWWKKLREADALHEQLWEAIRKNDVPGVVLAVTEGASLRAQFRSNEPNPPLIYPSLYGWNEMLETLIDLGADVNQSGENGSTPLMSAAYSGNADIVECLLKNGARLDAFDKDRETPLDYARNSKNDGARDQIIRILISHGAE